MNRPAVAFTATVLMLLGACASPSRQVRIIAQPGANHDSATAVDIVLVHTAEALAVMPESADAWFASKPGLRTSLADAITVVSLQVVPSSSIEEVALPAARRPPVAVLGFARYLDATGAPAGVLTPWRCAQIVLGPSAASYSACP